MTAEAIYKLDRRPYMQNNAPPPAAAAAEAAIRRAAAVGPRRRRTAAPELPSGRAHPLKSKTRPVRTLKSFSDEKASQNPGDCDRKKVVQEIELSQRRPGRLPLTRRTPNPRSHALSVAPSPTDALPRRHDRARPGGHSRAREPDRRHPSGIRRAPPSPAHWPTWATAICAAAAGRADAARRATPAFTRRPIWREGSPAASSTTPTRSATAMIPVSSCALRDLIPGGRPPDLGLDHTHASSSSPPPRRTPHRDRGRDGFVCVIGARERSVRVRQITESRASPHVSLRHGSPCRRHAIVPNPRVERSPQRGVARFGARATRRGGKVFSQ